MVVADPDPFETVVAARAPGPVVLTLPYPISANRYWATRVITPKGQTRAQAMTYVTSEAKQFKESVAWLARAAGVREPIKGRVAIEYTLHPHRPLDWLKRMRKDPAGWEDTVMCMDLDNAQKVLLDALKGIVMEDDSWVRSIKATRGEPRQQAVLVVTVAPMPVVVDQEALAL